MSITHILESLEADLSLIERSIIAGVQTPIPLLTQVAEHILRSGGKRLRPALVILGGRLCQVSGEAVLKTAQVIEYLHTATLLHDDVVDNAETRRYQQTACRIWGNEASVLVGDYLFAFTFHSLVQLNNLAILEVISETTNLMAKGELLQLAQTWETMDEAAYLEIIFNKTACLFAAAIKMGALLGTASDNILQSLYEYGAAIGMAFQIVDDVLDYMPEEAQTGKPVGIDLQEKKVTLPLSHLLAYANPVDQATVRAILAEEVITNASFQQIIHLMEGYQSLAYSLQTANQYVQKAKEYLAEIPDSPTRQTLISIAEFIVQRRV